MTTLNDRQVLNAILNPNTPFEEDDSLENSKEPSKRFFLFINM
jgi:hypothetical protein